MLWAYYDAVPTAEKHLEIRDCLERAVAENGEDAIAFAALVSVRGLYESDESVIRRPLLKS